MCFFKLAELLEGTAPVCEGGARWRNRNGAIKFRDGHMRLLPCTQDGPAIEMRIGEVRRQGDGFLKPVVRFFCLVQNKEHKNKKKKDKGSVGIGAGGFLEQWL